MQCDIPVLFPEDHILIASVYSGRVYSINMEHKVSTIYRRFLIS